MNAVFPAPVQGGQFFYNWKSSYGMTLLNQM